MRLHSLLPFLLVLACNSTRPAIVAPEAGPTPSASTSVARPATAATAATTFDAALARDGLVPITLIEVSRVVGTGSGVKAGPGELVVTYTTGWKAEPARFARRPNGAIVRLSDMPKIVVDRRVEAGCPPFAGGGGDFVTAVFRLPTGAPFEGNYDVVYEKHVDEPVYSQGAQCPPPAMD